MNTPTSDSPAHKSQPIGFVGLGAMGGPMARWLASLGYQLHVFDLNAEAVRSVVALGARAAESPREVGDHASLVFTCLPSLNAITSVVLGDQGLCAGSAFKTLADCSTTGAEYARDMAERLARRGIMFLDSPITGNVTTAGNGKLGIMCSGPHDAFILAQPYMHALASMTVLYLGEQNGKAQTLKLLNNLLSATGMAATCEALLLGVKWGLDPKVMLEVINCGEASSSASRNKFAKSILPRKFDFGARMAITAKDISLTVEESEELGVPMWIAQAVRQIWKYAASQGGAEKDGTSLITFLEPWAGIEVRTGAGEPAPVINAGPGADISNELVIVTDARMAVALKRWLIQGGWNVQNTLQPNISAGAARDCTLLSAPAGSSVADIIGLLGKNQSGSRTIVNACVMPSANCMELASVLSNQGDACVEALPAGSLRDAENGTCPVLVSGPASSLARAQALLESLGKRVIAVSERHGAAQIMQQINGSLFDILFAVSCESFVTGAKAGLDPLTMTRILGIETGRNAASERVIPEQVATRRFDHGKRISEAFQDLSLASDEARRLGVTPWIFDKSRLLYGLATQLSGPDQDITRLVTHYENWAGVEVRADTVA